MDLKISDDQRAIREAVASICKRFDLASRRNARAEWLKRKIEHAGVSRSTNNHH